MKKSIIILFYFLITGCQSISYKPALSLGESAYPINGKVQMNQFVDVSPQDDKKQKAFSLSATEPNALAGDLATEVTNAILTDFSSNQVFQTIKKRIDNPDIIMNGTIHRFYGEAGINTLGWVTLPIDLIWFFGLPIQDQNGAVNIEITLQLPNGEIIGTYRGTAEFSDSYSIYTNLQLAIGTSLNKAFDNAIQQIRNQIVADKYRIESRASTAN